MQVEETENSIKIISNCFKNKEVDTKLELLQLCNDFKAVTDKIDEIIVRNKLTQIESRERFNVFACLTRHHLEELHSKFIYYLLNPKETHDCNIFFLHQFIKVLKEDALISDEIPELSERELKGAKVVREKFIGRSEDSEIYGFIDIFIETDSFVIAIENKITAWEQSDQIERYARYCKRLSKHYIVIYLTLWGNQSAESGNETYYPASYSHHILKWLQQCINTIEYEHVKTGLKFYAGIINDIILKRPSNKIIMEIKDLLLKEENKIILKYMNEIEAAREPIRNHLRTEFFLKIQQELTDKKYRASPYSNQEGVLSQIKASEIWVEKLRGIRFIDDRYIYKKGNYTVSFFIEHNWSNLYYGLVILDKDGRFLNDIDYKKHDFIVSILERMNEKLNNNLEFPEEGFYAWAYFHPDDKAFPQDELNYYFAKNMDDIIQKFIDVIKKYVFSWEEVIVDISRNKK